MDIPNYSQFRYWKRSHSRAWTIVEIMRDYRGPGCPSVHFLGDDIAYPPEELNGELGPAIPSDLEAEDTEQTYADLRTREANDAQA